MPQGHSPVVPQSAQKRLTRPEERGMICTCGFASQRGSRGPELPPAGGAASLPHAARPAVLENDPMRTGHVLVGQPGPTQVTGAGQERPASRDTPGVTRAIGAGSEAAAPPGADPSLRPPPPRPSSLQHAHLVADPGGDPEGLCHPDQTGSIAVARAGLHATVEVARPHPLLRAQHTQSPRRGPVCHGRLAIQVGSPTRTLVPSGCPGEESPCDDRILVPEGLRRAGPVLPPGDTEARTGGQPVHGHRLVPSMAGLRRRLPSATSLLPPHSAPWTPRSPSKPPFHA